MMTKLFYRIIRIVLILISSLVVFLLALPLAFYIRIRKIFITRYEKTIFLGIHEIANNIQSISDCLSQKGYRCQVLILQNTFYGIKSIENSKHLQITYLDQTNRWANLITDILLPFKFLPYFLSNDMFFIIWKRSFMIGSIDFLLIKIAGIKLLLMHCGDDVRYRTMQKYIDREFKIDSWRTDRPSVIDFLKKFYYQRISEKVGTVISTRNQSTFQASPLVHFMFPQIALLSEPKKPKKIPLILHCPSDPKIKGTDIVLQAIDSLKDKNIEFEFELVTNKKNDYVLQRVLNADIVIDQPGTWIARLAVEAMAAGCCVIGGNRADYQQWYDSPVIQFEPDAKDLADRLQELILNLYKRENKMNECFQFWKDYYSYDAYTGYFISILEAIAPTYLPLHNHKAILLKGASSILEKMIVKLFYHQKDNS